MLNAKDGAEYRNQIERVMPGFFSRVNVYLNNIDKTHMLLGENYMNRIRDIDTNYLEKIEIRDSAKLVFLFLKQIDQDISNSFGMKFKNKEIDFDSKMNLGTTKYNSETGTTKIIVQCKNNIMDASVMLHEYMHSLTNKFSGSSLMEMAENRKYQEQISIYSEFAFIRFLHKLSKYQSDLERIFNYRLRFALLFSPGELQTKLMALLYASENRTQEEFERKFGPRLPMLEHEIKKFIPPNIEDYYLGTMSAIDNMKNGDEIDKLRQIFLNLKNNDFNKVKEIMPMSCDADRDVKNIINFYKIFD